MRDEEIKIIYGMYSDCWRFFKQFSSVRTDDEFWETVAAEAKKIVEKYKGSQFSKDLIVATLSELERREKELKKSAKT